MELREKRQQDREMRRASPNGMNQLPNTGFSYREMREFQRRVGINHYEQMIKAVGDVISQLSQIGEATKEYRKELPF